ncbi:DNA polymerase I [Candidatus Hepatobacter penaei]|uniref:DNA polymerase I n=1 Tax=Candidatus Hepatobacter penaei TaxID=1274402 RepID=UPI0004F2E8A5|nr:DNA polymerase I [Candidatus Hepatobacter penaei]
MSLTVYLVDVSHFIFRAYHALPPLERPDGTPVGAVYGFLSMVLKLIDSHKIDALGMVFDSKAPTFRHHIDPAYKANRPPPPPDLAVQFSLVHEACEAFGFVCLQCDGFEADDIMATYATQNAAQESHTVLVSSDKDLMQLINPHIRMFDAIKNTFIEADAVRKKLGVDPGQVIDFQALTGDASDNIPGVPGVGPKTAAQLIHDFGSLDNLYHHLDQITKPRLQQRLTEHKDKAFLSQQLARLDPQVPLTVPLEKLQFHGITYDHAKAFLETNHFKTLVKRLRAPSEPHGLSPTSYPLTWIDTPETWALWQKHIRAKGIIALATTHDHEQRDGDEQGPSWALFHPDLGGAILSPSLATKEPFVHDPSVLHVMHGAPASLTSAGTHISYDDTFLMAYLLEGPSQKNALEHYQALTQTPEPHFEGPQEPIKDIFKEALCEAWATWHVMPLMKQALREGAMWALYQKIDKPLQTVLTSMEQAGILLDTAKLTRLGHTFQTHIDAEEQTIFSLAGTTFNVASPKQLGEILFTKLGLTPVGKRGKAGTYSTNSDVLEKLDHPITAPLLRFRQFSKLKSTYVDGLLHALPEGSQRLHTTFLACGTSTGRLASIKPNLQNIPIREPEGRDIRKAFIPSPGHVLLSIDYSQIELRLLAHIGHITPLIEAFKRGEDIHQKTASEMFAIPLADVTPTLRRHAKMINFGIIYGISAYGLAERLAIPQDKAKDYIERYLERYAGIKTYMDTQIALAQSKGYVKTLWGRRCYIPQIHHKNPTLRGMAERLAINAPLQGTSADFIRDAMVKIGAFLTKEQSKLTLLLQIHDELLFEGPADEVARLIPQLETIMSGVASLDVPLVVSSSTGLSWEEAHA